MRSLATLVTEYRPTETLLVYYAALRFVKAISQTGWDPPVPSADRSMWVRLVGEDGMHVGLDPRVFAHLAN